VGDETIQVLPSNFRGWFAGKRKKEHQVT
jgi:hypothetical protein